MNLEMSGHLKQEKMSKLFSKAIKKIVHKIFQENVELLCDLKTFKLIIEDDALFDLEFNLAIEDIFVKKFLEEKKIPRLFLPLSGIVSNWKVVKRKISNSVSKKIREKTGIEVVVNLKELEKSKKKGCDYLYADISVNSNINEIKNFLNKKLSKTGQRIDLKQQHIFISIEEDSVKYNIKSVMELNPN